MDKKLNFSFLFLWKLVWHIQRLSVDARNEIILFLRITGCVCENKVSNSPTGVKPSYAAKDVYDVPWNISKCLRSLKFVYVVGT